eukprot:TRINITY_DN3342_c0_g1_i2.p1 TRINITY_DN3342_c0_g1~~TRINITY_DN3342_c0_g1_i2.p1  ORF type:complete len:270 (+),score=54.30 TRINITY_DN3342_c0_g1_i2:736-1545(+)
MLNDFIHRVGCPEDLRFVDVLGTDDCLLAMVPGQALAVTLLFPCGEVDRGQVTPTPDAGPFYMRQFVGNACGTIATIHCLANNTDNIEIQEGPLQEFIRANQGLSAEHIGTALGEAEGLHEVSEAAAVNEENTTESSIAQAVSGAIDCHFICFVHRDGMLWELDGCRGGPVSHGASSPQTFLSDAARVIQAEFLSKSTSHNFNLMALTHGSTALNDQTPTNGGAYPLQRTHSGIVKDLLDMGFGPEAVEFAVAASGGGSVQAAMDLLMG